MITRKEIDFDAPLTEAQVHMLEAMESQPAIPDDDCPEYTVAAMEEAIEAGAAALNPARSFYSESNIRYLEGIMRDVKDGKAHFAEHDLIEDE